MKQKGKTLLALATIAVTTIHIINRIQYSHATIKGILPATENKYYEFVKDDGWIKGDDPWEKEKIKEIIKNTALVMQIIGHKIPQTQMYEDIYKSFGISF